MIEDNLNFHQMFEKVKEAGYSSTYPNFFKQLKTRLMTATLGNTYQLSRHNLGKLLYKNDIKRLKLDEDNEKHLKEYLCQDNQESLFLRIVEEFTKCFDEKNETLLDDWINKYQVLNQYQSLQTFIKGVKNDIKAVKAQISNTITNGTTEGLVSKIKVIKKRTYGRCGFDLLKCLLI